MEEQIGLSSESKKLLISPSVGKYGGLDTHNDRVHKEAVDGDDDMHCHTPGADEDRLDKVARRKLLIASGLCLTFMIAEIVGGVLANSLAIATDAAHLLTDFASFMISLFAIFFASRPATKKMSFGYYRAEVMGALISVLLIWVVTGVLVYMAIERIISGEYEIDAVIMLITAGIGVCFNIIMGCSLHDHGHGHSHGGGGHSHGEDNIDKDSISKEDEENGLVKKTKKKKSPVNINVRAAYIHVIGDFIQSIGVFIAALIIYLRPEWKIADPICTFLFSVLVLFTTITILKHTLNVLMEGTPRNLSFNAVKTALNDLAGVKEVHNLRIWSLTLSKTAVAAHLALESKLDTQAILVSAAGMLKEKFNVYESTIQIENWTTDMDDCTQCQDPAD